MAKFRFQYQAYAAPVLVPLSVFGWFNSLSEPVQIEPGLSAAWQQVTSVGTSQVELQTGTYVGIYPLSEPVRVKPPLPEGAKQSFGTDWQWTMAAIPWPAPALSEPVQVKQWLGPAAQQFFAMDAKWERPAVQNFPNWYLSLSEPVQTKRWLNSPSQQFLAIDAKWDAPAPRMDSWHKLLAEPVRYKIPVAWQQPFAMDWKWERPAVQNFPNWYAWFSEPVRSKPALTTANQTFRAEFDWNWNAPPPRIDSWHRQLTEPVRYKIPVAWQQPFAIDWKFERPAVQSFPNWYAWLSEPVRQKLALPAGEQQFFTIDWKWDAPAPRADSWFKWFSEPVRFRVPVAWQQPFTTDWQWNAPSVTPFFGAALSEPVRVAPRVAYQQPYTTDWKWVRPSAKFPEWYNLLTEPVRSLPPFRADRQQFYVADWRTPQTTLGSWYKWLSEPVRYRIQPAALQEPFRTDWQWTAPSAVTDLRNFWFSWLTEPVRFKPALWAANQQFFTTDSAWLAPLINYRFAITETRDVAALVYSVIGEPVVGANVTITEIPVGNMANVTISELLP